MSQKVLTLELVRDGQCTPWGFRMSGGADIGTPLLIQRICFGSPSEGELQKGDIILSIGGNDARKMSHQRATDLISKAGNNLKLVVARNPGPPSTGSSPAMSPTPPLALLSQQGSAEYFKPLPRTEFHNDVGSRSGQHRDDKSAITNQAYRTLPLITPELKTSKDCPVGSYLRHSKDTSGRSTASKTNDPYMLTKVQEAILEAAISSPRASLSSSRTSTPDIGYQNVTIRQYNSPINMYSHQAIVETLNAQTSATKPSRELPRVQTPEKLVPMDISKSPTYQLIHEEEVKNVNKQKMEEQKPVETKVHDLHEVPKSTFGTHEAIQQSGSFRVLMATLKSTPGV